MMAELHDFGNKGMSVMDGRRCLAMAKKVHGGWLLRLHGASWIDTMTNESQRAWLAQLGLRPDVSPFLKLVTSKREARKHLTAIARQSTKPEAL